MKTRWNSTEKIISDWHKRSLALFCVTFLEWMCTYSVIRAKFCFTYCIFNKATNKSNITQNGISPFGVFVRETNEFQLPSDDTANIFSHFCCFFAFICICTRETGMYCRRYSLPILSSFVEMIQMKHEEYGIYMQIKYKETEKNIWLRHRGNRMPANVRSSRV